MNPVTKRHDKDSFFKYYTAASAKITLENATRKWSTPFLFNDPFDNQFDLYFEEPSEALAAENLARFQRIVTSPEPIKDNQFGSHTDDVRLIQQVHLQNPDFQYTEEEMAYLLEGEIEGMQQTVNIMPEINADLRSKMADTSIFCLSETHDNLLMWSHYAQHHTGAVIKFLALPEVDSPLIVAQPVRYTSQVPRLTFSRLMDFDAALRETLNTITLTKSEVWAYEREWRIVTTLRDKAQAHEILPFAPEEVGAVYLGCKIDENDKNEIIAITRRKYPQAKIFQAEKHEREFALAFRDIT